MLFGNALLPDAKSEWNIPEKILTEGVEDMEFPGVSK